MKKVNDMRTKKLLLAGVLFILAIIVVSAIGLRSNITQDQELPQQYVFSIQDTTKVPETISVKKTTHIEIVNGKKKITETIIKMRGDSIIEKKVIEKEEDAGNNNFDIDPDSLNRFNYNFFNKNPFGFDSIFPQLEFQFGQGQNFSFGFSSDGFDNDILKKFGFDFDMNMFKKDMDEKFDKMVPKKNDDPRDINPFKDQKSPNVPRFNHSEHKNNPKSINEIITEHLLNDGFINDIDQKYKFELNEKYLKINGKKQDKAIYDKYKKIIEDNTGIELEGEFNFNLVNKKKLNKKTIRL